MWFTIPKGEDLEPLIFDISSDQQFEQTALAVFRFQRQHNPIYKSYCELLGVDLNSVRCIDNIPFLPISFFKTGKVVTTDFMPEAVFESSGTTASTTSKHYVKNLALYTTSFTSAFESVYGLLKDYAILGLLPSYLEKEKSSLIFMVKEWMQIGGHNHNGFFLDDHKQLAEKLTILQGQGQKTILIGVTYALLDFAAAFPKSLTNVIVMETGGMKGRRKEMTREEVHAELSGAFNLTSIHSEYGMTELLSQAYAVRSGKFLPPKWMKVRVRHEDDPLALMAMTNGVSTGIINIIDLANIWSCSFIATDDLGRLYADGTFEVLGRMDGSDIRGCSLLAV